MNIIEHKIIGNYEAKIRLVNTHSTFSARIYFSGDRNIDKAGFLDISQDNFSIGRTIAGKENIWKKYRTDYNGKLDIKILRKGGFFRFWINEHTAHIRGPMGEWMGEGEPWETNMSIDTINAIAVESFIIESLPWLSEHNEPIIKHGPRGSFYEEQAIPGCILELDGIYYMYFMAGMSGDEEGASKRTIGLAVSKNLIDWRVHPTPVIELGDANFSHDNLYPGSAVIAPDGRITIVYAAQKFPRWEGFGMAMSESPYGPFQQYPGNPIYKHFNENAHEFDLIETENYDSRYLMLYAGFTPEPDTGLPGDRAYLITSDDLVNWEFNEKNPVFIPSTLDNWDGTHIRPRSLNRIDGLWYLWYEGCHGWKPPYPDGEDLQHWDTVGLARSEDLHQWEYYPKNPALPGLGTKGQFDSQWVGWPRMVVKDGIGYVFYTGSGSILPSIGMRQISINDLDNWGSEGGDKIVVI